MKILSDFRDHYDIWADNSGPIFYRFAENFGPRRLRQFDIIHENGFNVIPHGHGSLLFHYNNWKFYNSRGKCRKNDFFCKEKQEIYSDEKIEKVVVYRSENHCGLDKSIEELRKIYSIGLENRLVSTLSESSLGRSLRLLRIGDYLFSIEMWSNDDWRSNYGDGGEKIISYQKFINYRKDINIDLPLWAIDFVYKDDLLLGVDFNISPGTKVSGISKYMHAQDIHDEINNWLKNENNYKRYIKYLHQINDGENLLKKE